MDLFKPFNTYLNKKSSGLFIKKALFAAVGTLLLVTPFSISAAQDPTPNSEDEIRRDLTHYTEALCLSFDEDKELRDDGSQWIQQIKDKYQNIDFPSVTAEIDKTVTEIYGSKAPEEKASDVKYLYDWVEGEDYNRGVILPVRRCFEYAQKRSSASMVNRAVKKALQPND